MARVGAPAPTSEDEAVAKLVELGWSDEEIDGVVTLHGATLKSWNVLANGRGFDLQFTVPLGEVAKLAEMTPFLQRVVELKVTRYSRGLRKVVEDDDGVNWLGVED